VSVSPKPRRAAVDRCIILAASRASPGDPKEARSIARFLRTGKLDTDDEMPDGKALEWMRDAKVKDERRVAALRDLFRRLAEHLPPEAREVSMVAPSDVEELVRPMVEGLVQRDWRTVALRELGRRVFVLNRETTAAAVEAELSTTWTYHAWQVLWLYFEDYGLAPKGLRLGMSGISAGTFAHIRPSAQKEKDPYCDVVVHEAAHLLHYLKPGNFGLPVKRGQERFLDVRFDSRELLAYVCEAYSKCVAMDDRAARLAFVDRFAEEAGSFPDDCRGRIAELLVAAARARDGWKVIRDAVVEPPRRRQ